MFGVSLFSSTLETKMLQPECGAKVVVEKKTTMIKDAHQFGNVPVFTHPLSL